MSYYLLLLIPLVLILFLLYWYWLFYKYLSHLKYAKSSPQEYPLVGISLALLLSKSPLDYFLNMFREHGTIRFMLGFEPAFASSDYAFNELVMSNMTGALTCKATAYEYLQDWLGLGLLTSCGERWKARRKAITPAFHFTILEKFVDTFDGAAQEMVNALKQDENYDSLDIYPYVTACTLDVICETAMGTKVNAQKDHDSPYIKAVSTMTRVVMEKTINPIQRNWLLYYLTPNYWTERRCLKILHGYTNDVIKSRRQGIAARVDMDGPGIDEEAGMKNRVAFLDLLLQCTINGQPLSDTDISEEVETFMFEGHDTTASAISFCLYALGNNPEIQDRVIAEQREIFGESRDCMASYKDLQSMKYLELVIKETLRLYPSVPLFGRTVQVETIYNGMTLKKGLQILVNPYAMHRDPRYFSEPDKFNPERFSNENYDGKLPYAYIPFSAGPRNCIGQKFAVLELKSTISKVLRNFEVFPTFPVHELHMMPETILKSSNGIKIKITPRTW